MNQKLLPLYALLFAVLLFIMGCQPKHTEQKNLPVIKISNKNWKKAKFQKEDRREGPQNFYALHHDIRTRDGELSPRYETNYRQKALQKAIRLNKNKSKAREDLDWIERGPGNVGGRTRGLIVDKRDTTFLTWLAGSAGGGIWKTEDGSKSWRLVTEELPNMSVATLASTDNNPDIIYAGTGEGFDDNMIKGDGIYKSIDGGENWTLLTSTGNNPQFANVLRMVVNPDDPNEILAATRADFRVQPDTSLSTMVGYIMKSTDGGLTWKTVYEITNDPSDTFAPTVQQIVADPTDFNTLYAAVRATHILKSTDKGENWTIVFNAKETGIGRMELAISRVDNQYIYIAAVTKGGSGLIRSTDAGVTWEEVIGEYGDWLGGQGWYDNTIAAHPYDANTVFVAGAGAMLRITVNTETSEVVTIGEVTNSTDFLNLFNPLGGDAVGTTEDFMIGLFGTALAQSPDGLVEVEIRFGLGKEQKAHRHIFGENIFNTYIDYVNVPFEVWDVPNNRQLMVSFVEDQEDGTWNLIEIGEEDEDAFPEVLSIHAIEYDTNPSPELASFLNASYYTVFGGIEVGATVDVNNLSEGTLLIETDLASGLSSTFEPVTDGYGEYAFTNPTSSKGVHVDHHNIVLIPIDEASQNFYILNANDGGVAFSTDAGATFLQTGDAFKEEVNPFDGTTQTFPTTMGYNTSQFYGVDKMNGGDRYVGGTQDNGSWVSPADVDDQSVWVAAPSGDGFEAAWNYGNPNLILESSQFNNISRSEDGGATWTGLSLPGRGPFVTRISASKQDPDLVFAVSSAGVLKSSDFGLNWTAASMPDEWVFNGRDNTVKVSLASPGVVWSAGSVNEEERIAVSVDGGESFEATSGYDQAKLGLVTGLATHPLDKNTAYALFSIGDGPKILMTKDLGQTWTDISGFGGNQSESNNGFPDVATYSLVVMPFDTNQIWAGTEIGLFESLDGGAIWSFADNGLPPVAIWEMLIVNDEVVLATHGRGIWTVSLPELAGYEPIEAKLGPQVVVTSKGFNGVIAGEANLRSAYDSTIIIITIPISEEETITTEVFLAGNDSAMVVPFDVLFLLDTDTIVEAQIKATSFAEEELFKSSTTTLIFDVDEDPITEYSNNFDDGQSDFARLGFNAFQEVGFADQALHSPHPYPGNNQEFIAIFQKPITVGTNNSIFSFDEIVLVEPGDSEEFGSQDFYDFVTIEGTSDNGKTWTTLDGYDSRRSNDWLGAYNDEAVGVPSLIESHSIDLRDFYNGGDIVYLRFRLVSDPLAEGWGWMIDNIVLASEITAVKEISAEVELQSYPNPFSNSTILRYTLAEKSEVIAELYSVNGKQVSTLIQAKQGAGTHTYQVNTTRLEAGIYFCRFKVNGAEKTFKWVKK